MKHEVLPPAALQQHIAIIGKTGSGKTYTGKGIVEKMLAAGRRVCILDPTGAWYGLRSSADGRKAGFPIIVFGGDHADVPITEHAGNALGELIGRGNLPAVIDLSGTTLGERHRFVERFCESVFRVNKSPLHLIIDEADEFAPQSGAPGTERMLGAVDRIVRRGRIKGFRVMMISQRPAVLNKNVLTQANTLIAMRLPASQDRKAVELWIRGQADEAQATEVLESLAKLQRGEGWVWSPEHNMLKRVHFPRISTFDSSRTPDDGEALAPPACLADVDLSAVKTAMAAAVEEAAGNDVGLLKKKIVELEKRCKPVPEAPANATALVNALRERDGAIAERDEAVRAARTFGTFANTYYALLDGQIRLLTERGSDLAKTLNEVGVMPRVPAEPSAAPPGLKSLNGTHPRVPVAATATRGYIPAAPSGLRREPEHIEREPLVGVEGLGGPHRKILDAIAWWKAAGIEVPTRGQVAAVAVYAPTGGSFNRYISALSSMGLISYPDQGSIDLTPAGSAIARGPDVAPSIEELHQRVRQILDGPHTKILNVLLEAGGRELGRTAVAEQSGYEASGGSFNRYVSHLSSLKLIRYPKKTTVAAAPWLFGVAAR